MLNIMSAESNPQKGINKVYWETEGGGEGKLGDWEKTGGEN